MADEGKLYLRKYVDGFKDALLEGALELQKNERKGRGILGYGVYYENVARETGDCLNCKDIGSDKGCAIGKTIWCPRLLETLKE